jgi:hypothetical protein
MKSQVFSHLSSLQATGQIPGVTRLARLDELLELFRLALEYFSTLL